MANPGRTNSHFCNPDRVLPNYTSISMDFCMMHDEKNPGTFVPSLTDIVKGENISLNEDDNSDRSENSVPSQVEPIVFPAKKLRLKRKLGMAEGEVPEEDKTNTNSSGPEDQKKKPGVSNDVQRCVKNARCKKNQKLERSGNEAEETNAESDGQGFISFASEDDNANQENSGASKSSPNSNGKTRASRGSATDPQSLYARKRRERINERLRILQNLVPKGTKVDISTMLEEAVHYVKFLQLQIKLLSSDALRMYAPIAYNGFDIGLDLVKKITPSL